MNKLIQQLTLIMSIALLAGAQSLIGAAAPQKQSHKYQSLTAAIKVGDLATVMSIVPSQIPAHRVLKQTAEQIKKGFKPETLVQFAQRYNQPAIAAYLAAQAGKNHKVTADKTATAKAAKPTATATALPLARSLVPAYEAHEQVVVKIVPFDPQVLSDALSADTKARLKALSKKISDESFALSPEWNRIAASSQNYPFVLDGKEWQSVQHYFLAQRLTDATAQEEVRTARGPNAEIKAWVKNKAFEKHHLSHSEEEAIKEKALFALVTQHQALKQTLLASRNKRLFIVYSANSSGDVDHVVTKVRNVLLKEESAAAQTAASKK